MREVIVNGSCCEWGCDKRGGCVGGVVRAVVGCGLLVVVDGGGFCGDLDVGYIQIHRCQGEQVQQSEHLKIREVFLGQGAGVEDEVDVGGGEEHIRRVVHPLSYRYDAGCVPGVLDVRGWLSKLLGN